MVEAPEARVLAVQLARTLKGLTVAEVVAGFTPHKFAWFNGDPADYSARLLGKRVEDARAVGGMIEMTVGDMSLILSEGPNLSYIPPGGALPGKHQLLLGFDDESALVVSVRMYGGIMCFPRGKIEGNLAGYYHAARDKPQVMSPAFTRTYFRSLTNTPANRGKSVKALLATGQTIPGLGNGVLQDILYNARIHPKAKLESLSATQIEGLYDSLKTTLGDMSRAGGRSSETDIFGRPGEYVALLSKDTAGTPCPRCERTIRKENYMGGTIYYCPGCQPV